MGKGMVFHRSKAVVLGRIAKRYCDKTEVVKVPEHYLQTYPGYEKVFHFILENGAKCTENE